MIDQNNPALSFKLSLNGTLMTNGIFPGENKFKSLENDKTYDVIVYISPHKGDLKMFFSNTDSYFSDEGNQQLKNGQYQLGFESKGVTTVSVTSFT